MSQLISIEPIGGSWNGRRTIFFQCEHEEWNMPDRDETYTARCGGDASYLITKRGELTDRIFTLKLCNRHAKPYLEV